MIKIWKWEERREEFIILFIILALLLVFITDPAASITRNVFDIEKKIGVR